MDDHQFDYIAISALSASNIIISSQAHQTLSLSLSLCICEDRGNCYFPMMMMMMMIILVSRSQEHGAAHIYGGK